MSTGDPDDHSKTWVEDPSTAAGPRAIPVDRYTDRGLLGTGGMSEVRRVHGVCFRARVPIGKGKSAMPIPDVVDYDLWTGPAPLEALQRERLHYDWRFRFSACDASSVVKGSLTEANTRRRTVYGGERETGKAGQERVPAESPGEVGQQGPRRTRIGARADALQGVCADRG